MLPSSLDLRITSKCNLNCKFCFGTNCKHELKLNQWDVLLNKFWLNGVRNLVITGGEPTLFSDIHKLIARAKSIGFSLTLSTNGSLYINQNCSYILSNLDWISIPVEGSTLETNTIMRGIDIEFYNNILDLIKFIKLEYPVKIKLGTVVTQKNFQDIYNIVDFAKKYADTWKLYQVYLCGKSKDVIDEFGVSDFEYEEMYKKISQTLAGKINVVRYSNKTMNGKYLFCEPDGSAMTIVNNREHIFGNFLYNFDDVLKMWTQYVNSERLIKNFNMTYFQNN